MSRTIFLSSRTMGNKHQVNLKLADNLAEMLARICQYHDSDQSHMLRQLIVQEYRRIQSEKSSRAGSTQGEQGEAGEVGEGAVRRGPVPPKVSGRSGKADRQQKHDPGLQKTG